MKERVKFIDVASGIMIVWVLCYHAIWPFVKCNVLHIVPWLYFFMPWFFYKSGLLFTLKDAKSEWKNSSSRLLRTYVIWSAVGFLIYCVYKYYIRDFSLETIGCELAKEFLLRFRVPVNEALWFLPVLFIVRQIANFLLQRTKTIYVVLTSLGTCVGLMCLFPAYNVISWWFCAVAWGLFFFSFAYWIKDYETQWWVLCVSIIVYVLTLFTSIPYVYGESSSLLLRIVWLFSCAMACPLWDMFCRGIVYTAGRFVHNVNDTFPILSYISRNALMIYAAHAVILWLTIAGMRMLSPEWLENWRGFVVVLVTYIVFLPFLNWCTKRLMFLLRGANE